MSQTNINVEIHTLHIRHALLQDLIERLRVLELLLDLPNHRLGKLPLLSCLHLTLVPNPRIENRLSLGSQCSLLLQLVGLGLKLSRLL